MLKTFASALAITTASATIALADLPETLNFGIIATESSDQLETSFGPFLEDMSEFLGVEVKPFFATDYAGVIEAMRFGNVDLAAFGNKSAIVAVDRSGGEVFAQTIGADGDTGYYSLLITQADNANLNSLEDVLACDTATSPAFGNGDPNSTSGFAVPSYYVWALNDVDPEECFETVTNSGHEANGLAVAAGHVSLSTFNTSAMGRLQKAHPEAAAKLKVIWTSPLIPSDPMVWRGDLDADAKAQILHFFMQYGRHGDLEKIKAERETLASVSEGWGPFLMSSNAQLLDVRQIEAFKKKIKAEAKNDAEAVAAAEASIEELKALAAAYGNGGY